MHDPDLLDALEAMAARSFVQPVWRVAWASRNPLAGGTGGGRWHPPNDFEALYTSLDQDGAMAEAYRHLSKAPVFSSSHVTINRLAVSAGRTLVFPDVALLDAVGVSEEAFRKGDYTRTREIGSAARFLDIDGLVVPGARWPGANLVLFPDRMANRDSLAVEETHDVNWPAWRERMAQARDG